MLLLLLLPWWGGWLYHAEERDSLLAVSYFPSYNSAAGRFNGALGNDFKGTDKSPYSLQNYRRSQIIPSGWVCAVSSCRHLGRGAERSLAVATPKPSPLKFFSKVAWTLACKGQ